MTTKIINLIKVILVIVSLGVVTVLAYVQGRASTGNNSVEVWNSVQNWRESTGRNEYVKSDLLCEFAAVRAYQINNNYSHDGFNNDSVYKNHAFETYKVLSENIGQFYNGYYTVLDGWLNSEPHRKALEADYTDACVVCVDKFCALEMGSK